MRLGRTVPTLPRALWLSLAGFGVLFTLTVVVVLGLGGVDRWISLEVLSIVTGVVGVSTCLVAAAARTGALRRAWVWFSLSVGMNTLGDVLYWITNRSLADLEILDTADAFYLAALLPAALGIIGYPVLTGGRRAWRVLVLDALVLMAAVLFLCHIFVVRPVSARVPDPWEVFGLTIYPLMTALLATLVALLLLRSEGHLRLDLVLGGTALVTYALSGSAYALASLPGAQPLLRTLGDLSYVGTPLIVAGAAAAAATLPTPRRTLRRHLTGVVTPLVPDLAALFALALAIVLTAQDGGTTVLGTVTLVAVGVRQMAQTASGERLRGELEQVVTERTRELAELTEAYRRLDAMKLEFVTAVSHELRTPLAAIRGSLEMLVEGDAGELPRPALAMIQIASRGSERLTRLVNDIIDLERLESGTFGFSPQVHDVPALVADVVGSLEALAVGGSVRLEVDAEPGRVWCDADRITQVLVNLVGNALKFTPQDSTVRVTARDEDEHVVFSVSDQGPGIPAEHLEAIFDRFHQVEMDESRQRGGAGLGLTICRHIVHRHGGRIWAENTPDGARIWFTLPRHVMAGSETGPQPAAVDRAAYESAVA